MVTGDRSLSRTSRHVFGLALAACLLVACGPSGPVPEGFLSYSEMRDEYDRTLDEFPVDLPFPEGVNPHPPLETQIVTDPETTDLYEAGSGESQAFAYWECAWMVEVLKANGAGERAERALDMLESALDSDFYRLYYEDPERVWELKVLGGARNGDLRLLREFAVGCHVDS